MGLRENAIEAYKKERELIKERDKIEAETFSRRALDALKDIIGREYTDIKTVVEQHGATSFSIDSILFRVTSSQGYHVVNLVKTCPRCETETTVRVLNLKDIGMALVEPHSSYDCDKIIDMKENEEGVRVLSTEERLLETLRDFIRENGSI